MMYYYYETFAQIYELAELDHEIEQMMGNWNIEQLDQTGTTSTSDTSDTSSSETEWRDDCEKWGDKYNA